MSCTKPLKVVQTSVSRRGGGVMGVSTLDDEVFVVLRRATQVDVYDAATMKIRRLLPLSSSASGENRGLAVCPVNKCVYVSDYGSNINVIHMW